MSPSTYSQNRCQSDHTVLNDAQMTFPSEEHFNPPMARMGIDQQRQECDYGKGIEEQSVKPVAVPQSALNKIRNRYGYQSAMNNAVASP